MRTPKLSSLWLVLSLLAAVYFFVTLKTKRTTPDPEVSMPSAPVTATAPRPPPPAAPAPRSRRLTIGAPPPATRPSPKGGRPAAKVAAAPRLNYVIDDGIAVVQGDVAVGVPTDPNAPATGIVEMRMPQSWRGEVIPYFIQPTVNDPDRVRRALQLFGRTKIKFVEFNGEEDALIFEPTSGVCKSYLGRVGGKQPVWIAPDCGPPEIAHEIMHALGFAHEQNRADRDEYITVNFDGIEDAYRFNFDKLPPEYVRSNLVTPFDFESLMIYPPWMFAKGGQTTMHPRAPDRQIAPGRVLSPLDEERVNKLP